MRTNRYGVQDFINKFPKGIEVFPSALGHRETSALISDQTQATTMAIGPEG